MGDRGRVLLISSVVILIALLLSGRFLANFYVDYLWHQSVGRTDVFWGVLRSKLLMFGLFSLTFVGLAVLNLVIADRLAPVTFTANTHPLVERFHEFFGRRMRSLRIVVAVVLGLLFAAPAIGQWQDWLMFRNSKSFGIQDAQFGNDIGFYLFRLPFISFVLDWLFVATIFITLLVIATHVLNGGIVVQPPRPKVRKATKAHLAVLLAVLAVLKAGSYWLSRYDLTVEKSGFVRGATYSVVHAALPAVILLTLVALLVAGLFLATLKTDSWRLPVIASALWAVMALLAGVIYPAVVQALVVNPNQRDREAPYIARNITATKHALGIDNVKVQDVSFGTVTSADLNADVAPLQNTRLVNPVSMVTRFKNDEGLRAGLTINDLDIDRYVIDGKLQQVVVAARELDLSQIANKSWQGQHLISTHGCGLVTAPATQVTTSGRPVYSEAALQRPELYFSDAISGYGIVDTSVNEDVCPGQDAATPYTGTGGVKLDSVFKRAAFALSYLDYNVIGSSAITGESRVMTVRRVQDRVRTLAPFLSFDGDPYPVQFEGGIIWVVDGYTTSNRYPYGESADTSQLDGSSGLNGSFNYVRNSVKATVDAYSGTVTFYIVDANDPIVKVWQSAFPNMFQPNEAMPDGIRAHLRYPEELFRVQTAAYSQYRLAPENFFDRFGAWSVAQAPQGQAPILNPDGSLTVSTDTTDGSGAFATSAATDRFIPYYTMIRTPGAAEATFQLYRPYVPFSSNDERRELQAFMTASSGPADYGQLTAYQVSKPLPGGPADVAAAISADSSVSQEITLLDQKGSEVVYGDLQMIPVGKGIVWVRPLYVQSTQVKQPTFQRMIVSYQGKVAIATSLQSALVKLFPGFKTDVGDVVGATTPDGGSVPVTPDTTGGSTPTAPPAVGTPSELLKQAEQLFIEADAALKSGDLGAYQTKIAAARALVAQALADLPA